jgi:hypothetical protein
VVKGLGNAQEKVGGQKPRQAILNQACTQLRTRQL